jgi:hypothetical protein
MNRIPLSIILFTLVLSMVPVNAPVHTQKITHDFWLEQFSFKSFPIVCQAGDSLHGSFLILVDGDQYQGDQQKYDIWPAVQGLTLMVFQNSEYLKWLNETDASSVLMKKGYSELSWNLKILESDIYYIVYQNDAITRKRIQGSIVIGNEVSQSIDYLLLPLGLIVFGVVCISLFSWNWKYRYPSDKKERRKL